jgi:hypothetical protein
MTDRALVDVRAYLASLVGREIKTLTGRPNRVLRLEGESVIVGTLRSPNGRPVPIKSVQGALDILERGGEVVIDVKLVGYRSAFIGAVLAWRRCLKQARRWRPDGSFGALGDVSGARAASYSDERCVWS